MEDYYDAACSFENLYRALKKCCRNVRWKDSVVGYEANGLKNTLELHERLVNGTYRISKYQEFVIHEPKERRILASRIVDRQFQRSLCDAGLYEDITEHFIRDNVACQQGRGMDDALRRMKVHLSRHYRRHGLKGYALKCDIHHFFQSIPHDVAKAAVHKYVSDRRAAEAVCDVIDSFGGEVGLGLGSQISQLVALLVLNDLDHYIKERLGIRGYIRYMDDFILIHEDKAYLRHCLNEIREKLAELGFVLNDKTCIYPLKQGIKFLQWRFILTDRGRILMRISRQKGTHQRRRMRKLWLREVKGTAPAGALKESVRAFLANAARGNARRIGAEVINYYEYLTERSWNA